MRFSATFLSFLKSITVCLVLLFFLGCDSSSFGISLFSDIFDSLAPLNAGAPVDEDALLYKERFCFVGGSEEEEEEEDDDEEEEEEEEVVVVIDDDEGEEERARLMETASDDVPGVFFDDACAELRVISSKYL